MVDNLPLREAFERSMLTLHHVADLAEMDSAVCARALGLRTLWDSRRKCKYYNKRMHYETAVKITRALNLDPVDVGL